MRKLYVNISEIRIMGDVSVLSDVISQIDMSMQDIAQATDQISERLVQGGVSNKGKAYEDMVRNVLAFRNEVFEGAASMNDMQGQIADYQNKIMRFEGMPEACITHNPFLANYSNIDVETGSSQYDISEMKALADDINLYCETVFYQIGEIVRLKNEIGSVWQDAQYKVFAEFVDEYNSSVIQSLKELSEYQSVMQERFKEFD